MTEWTYERTVTIYLIIKTMQRHMRPCQNITIEILLCYGLFKISYTVKVRPWGVVVGGSLMYLCLFLLKAKKSIVVFQTKQLQCALLT